MDSTINELYTLFAAERKLDGNPQYKKAFEQLNSALDTIEKLLPKEQRALLEKLFAAISELTLIESRDTFAEGFKLALRIAGECYN